jgi:hypothetical protein
MALVLRVEQLRSAPELRAEEMPGRAAPGVVRRRREPGGD